MVEQPLPIACPRCGGFKPLVENRFRTLCAECQQAVAHPIERLALGPASLIEMTGRMWLDNLGWVIPLSLVAALPMVLLRWFRPQEKWYVELPISLVTGSLVECVMLVAVARRSFSWLRPPELSTPMVAGVIAVNFATGIASMVGIVACFVGTFFIGNFLMLAVPLVVFDELPPHRALARSVVLSYRSYWRLFPATLLFSAPAMVISMLVGMVSGAAPYLARYAELLLGVKTFAPFVEKVLLTPNTLLQLTVWYFLVAAPTPPTRLP